MKSLSGGGHLPMTHIYEKNEILNKTGKSSGLPTATLDLSAPNAKELSTLV